MPAKTYLGDGAFIETGSYLGEIILTTSNGIRTTNTIVLGPEQNLAIAEFMRVWAKEEGIGI